MGNQSFLAAVRLPPSFAEKAMSIFARFFGKSDADDSGAGQLVANPKIEHPLKLQVLFAGPCSPDSNRLVDAFRTYDPPPVEQYVALAATAGILARLGAIVVLS